MRSIDDPMSKYHIYFVLLASVKVKSGDVEIDTTEQFKLSYLVCDEIEFFLLLQKKQIETQGERERKIERTYVLKIKAPKWEMSLCYVW